MSSTPASLLQRLRQPGDSRAWNEFVELYSPLLFHWARQTGLQEADAADLVQDVFAILVRRKKGDQGSDSPPMEPDELSGSAVRQIIKDVRGPGYQISFSVVDAADYGAAQHRLRFLMFGARDGSAPKIPSPTHGESAPDGQPFQTVRDAIYDLRHNAGPHSEYTPNVATYYPGKDDAHTSPTRQRGNPSLARRAREDLSRRGNMSARRSPMTGSSWTAPSATAGRLPAIAACSAICPWRPTPRTRMRFIPRWPTRFVFKKGGDESVRPRPPPVERRLRIA
jgi:site-specific DNA-cytosine methylase